MGRTALIMTMIALTTASHAGGVKVEVLRPAEITVPSSVQRIAVINRTGTRNLGEEVLVTLTDLVTGEAPGSDRAQSEDAVALLIAALDDSPRFEFVEVDADLSEHLGGLGARRLDAEVVQAICEDRCDAIVSLEKFDVEDDEPLLGVPTSSGDAVWRMYRASDGEILDQEDTWTLGFGSERVVNVYDAVFEGEAPRSHAEASAVAYLQRIVPTWELERHRLFSSSIGLRYGVRRARKGDWKSAMKAWSVVAKESSGRRRSRALYNMAIGYEIHDDQARADDHATAAVEEHESRATRRLADDLDARRRSVLRAERQLAMGE